ncbi:hypothetical protein BD310DRAFT_670063 [Dichomitus squalens]|uniref:Uncharacterized protein n=1 Tax=Dichomitus squalens TaxID=114155 RepID=A0A4Q9PNC1_9APHY|nr:hypothetical protein BD310DRAFT_670063 [Dichomitus squalens]
MRLLDTETGQFVEKDPRETIYAILSHTWDHIHGEQTYDQLKGLQSRYDPERQPKLTRIFRHPQAYQFSSDPQDRPSQLPSLVLRRTLGHLSRFLTPFSRLFRFARFPRSFWDDPRLSPKVRMACAVARAEGYRYIWIDSCCIDKASSSELSEAINCMYAWYAGADVCYAYLADVASVETPRSKWSPFGRSRWFKRGWTLQELIAPNDLRFLSREWEFIGSKHDLARVLEEITGISEEALRHEMALDEFSVAQRLSWASQRQTGRVEDQAYSLMGIFGINMPTLYGEGEGALRRLQEEIMRRTPDQSLFAWGGVLQNFHVHRELDAARPGPGAHQYTCKEYVEQASLFAAFLDGFEDASGVRHVPHEDVGRRLQLSPLPPIEYTFTPHGIRTQLPVIPLSAYLPPEATRCHDGLPLSHWYLAILGCEHSRHPDHLLGRVCHIPPSQSGIDFLYPGCIAISPDPEPVGAWWPDLLPLSPATMARCLPHIKLKAVFISHSNHAARALEIARSLPHKMLALTLLRKTREALRAQGYVGDLRRPDRHHPMSHVLTLSSEEYTIAIEYRHTLRRDGQRLTMGAHLSVSERLVGSARDVDSLTGEVSWSDRQPWWPSLLDKGITYRLEGKELTIKLGLDLAGPSRYSIRIVIHSDTMTAPPVEIQQEDEGDA